MPPLSRLRERAGGEGCVDYYEAFALVTVTCCAATFQKADGLFTDDRNGKIGRLSGGVALANANMAM